jgi:hypothetical protein
MGTVAHYSSRNCILLDQICENIRPIARLQILFWIRLIPARIKDPNPADRSVRCAVSEILNIYRTSTRKRRRIREFGGSRVVGQLEIAHPPNLPSLPTLKDSWEQVHSLPGRLVLPGFPLQQRGRIYAQRLGHLPLRQAEHPTIGGRGLYSRNRMMVGTLCKNTDPFNNCASLTISLVQIIGQFTRREGINQVGI